MEFGSTQCEYSRRWHDKKLGDFGTEAVKADQRIVLYKHLNEDTRAPTLGILLWMEEDSSNK